MKTTRHIIKNFFLAGMFIILVSGCGNKEQKTVYNNAPVNQNPVTKYDKNSITEPVKNENINKQEKTIGSTKMVHLTAAEFKQKVFNYETEKEWKFTGDVPVIIDFYADWCGPCKMVAPVLEELSKEYDGKVQIYKVDTEAEQELASVFGIRSIPSILFIPMDGKPQMSMGALPKESFVKAINEILLVN